MKVSRVRHRVPGSELFEPFEQFEPFTLAITVESVEEAQALYAIFNHASNIQLLYGEEKIRNAIGEKYYIYGGNNIIANGVKYDDFYQVESAGQSL